MFGRFLLLFILVPFIEMIILIRLGDYIGFWPTLALIILMGLLGLTMVRSQGMSVLRNFRKNIDAGVPPGQALLDGALIFAGGLLLITPGLITDIVGLLLLFPLTRKRISKLIAPWLVHKFFNSGHWYIHRW